MGKWHCFNVTVKLHYLYHIGQQAAWLHPTLTACWQGEDYVGRFRPVAAGAIIAASTSPARIAVSLMDKATRGQLPNLHNCVENRARFHDDNDGQ